jgi:hypothetical protein
MATKAQQFRSEMERNHTKKAAAKPDKHPPLKPAGDSGARNLKARTSKATVVTEENLSGRPSRKSSRSSVQHGKNSTVLEYASRMKSITPRARHEKR